MSRNKYLGCGEAGVLSGALSQLDSPYGHEPPLTQNTA